MNHLINQWITWSTNESPDQSMNHLNNQWITWAINESHEQSVNHLINQWITWTINQSSKQSINHLINQSINQSINAIQSSCLVSDGVLEKVHSLTGSSDWTVFKDVDALVIGGTGCKTKSKYQCCVSGQFIQIWIWVTQHDWIRPDLTGSGS